MYPIAPTVEAHGIELPSYPQRLSPTPSTSELPGLIQGPTIHPSIIETTAFRRYGLGQLLGFDACLAEIVPFFGVTGLRAACIYVVVFSFRRIVFF